MMTPEQPNVNLEDTPYQKLAKTPLASDTKIFGVEFYFASIVITTYTMVVDVVPVVIMSFLQILYSGLAQPEVKFVREEAKAIREEEISLADGFKKFESNNTSTPKPYTTPSAMYIDSPQATYEVLLASLAFILCCAHSLAFVLFVRNALKKEINYYFPWIITYLLLIFIGKLFLGTETVTFSKSLLYFDIPVLITMPVYYSKATLLERNKNYMLKGTAFYYVNPEDPQVLETGL